MRTGSNNLRIVLGSAKKLYVLETALPAKPMIEALEDEQNVWATKDNDHNLV